MPGDQEPTNVTLPQNPLHKGLFKEASKQDRFQTVTNPYLFEMNGFQFLGTSGQNIDDIYRFSDIDSRLDAAENSLLWRNIAPTAPDTLCTLVWFLPPH
jgi:DNA polymerase delta subunit 2